MKNDPVCDILNTLVTINKNRITGYKEILHIEHHLSKDENSAMQNRIIHSEKNIAELEQVIRHRGGTIDDKTSTAGFIYNTWMDIAYENTSQADGLTPKSGEDIEAMTLKAYTAALQQLELQTCYATVYRQKQEIAAAKN